MVKMWKKKLKAGKCKSVIKVARFDTESKFDDDDNERWFELNKRKMKMKSKIGGGRRKEVLGVEPKKAGNKM